MTTHNKEASFIVAEARPIVTSSQTSLVSDTTSRQTVQYQDIGIELTVRPLIGPNNVIQMEIDQKIDDISGNVTIGGDQQPIIGRRQATSYVSVANGELVVLGGLQRNRVNKERAKVAFFGDIPILGGLFTRRVDEDLKSELLVFIRPQVIRTTDEVHRDATNKWRNLEAQEAIERFLEKGELNINPAQEPARLIPEEDNEEASQPRNRPKGSRNR